MIPIAYWRWDNEGAHIKRTETFDSIAQRDRWVKAQRENNRRHPDEAQMVIVSVWPPPAGKTRGARDRGRRRPQLQLPYNDENLGPLFARREEAAPSRREDPSKTALQIASREFRKAMREGTPPPALVPQHAGRVVQDFAERRAARVERLRGRAERLERESEASRARRRQISDMIPMGQPILVGHHSERRHRADIGRMDRLMRKEVETHREAEDVKRRVRAAEAGRGGISSDDPEAVRLLQEKIAKAENLRAKTLEINKYIRMKASDEEILDMFRSLGWRDPARSLAALRSMGQQTLSTTNISADIRRMKARVEELTKRRAEPARAEEIVGDARIDEESNRVRIFFPGKPPAETRDALKRAGFRWSPTSGAWQRMASNQAWYEARRIAGGPARDPAVRPAGLRDPLRRGASRDRWSRAYERRWYLLDESLNQVGDDLTEKQAWAKAQAIANRYGKIVYVFEEDVTTRFEVHPRPRQGKRDPSVRSGSARRDRPLPKTPGYNSHLRIAFTVDRRGRPIAYYWSGHGYPGNPVSGRWIRMPLDAARIHVAQELATQVPYVSGSNASRTSNDRDPARSCPVGTRIQSLILSRVRFDRVGAIDWVVEHGHRARKIDANDASFRFRQEDPNQFREGSFRTIDLRPGVKAVIGCPR